MTEISVLDVFDNFLGVRDCSKALQLSKKEWRRLEDELRRFYNAWQSPERRSDRVFPGSWSPSRIGEPSASIVISNDVLLFGEVLALDPIEPFVSRHTRWLPPPTVEPPPTDVILVPSLVHVPSGKSGLAAQPVLAIYPPESKVFMPVTEAMMWNEGTQRKHALSFALSGLEQWRPLIEIGAIKLLPAYEVTFRNAAALAELSEAGRSSVSELFELKGVKRTGALCSIWTRGWKPRMNDETDEQANRRFDRCVSWVYSRERILCDVGGALYAPIERTDRLTIGAISADSPVARQLLSDPIEGTAFPGFSGFTPLELANLREHSNAYNQVRSKLRRMIDAAPIDLEGQPNARVAEFLSDHLNSELGNLRQEAASLSSRTTVRVIWDAIRLGLPSFASAAALGLPPAEAAASAGIGAAAHLGLSWFPRSGQDPNHEAMLWISRNIRGFEIQTQRRMDVRVDVVAGKPTPGLRSPPPD